MSVYGYERPTTPYLEQFAREGARFDLAMSTAPWTLPAHGSMFTGHRPLDIMNSIYRPLIDTFPVLAQALTDQGYATGGFVANMAYTTREHGLDRGFSHYEDYTLGWGNVLLASRLGNVLSERPFLRRIVGSWNQPGQKNAALINEQFIDWASDQKRPFFAFQLFRRPSALRVGGAVSIALRPGQLGTVSPLDAARRIQGSERG